MYGFQQIDPESFFNKSRSAQSSALQARSAMRPDTKIKTETSRTDAALGGALIGRQFGPEISNAVKALNNGKGELAKSVPNLGKEGVAAFKGAGVNAPAAAMPEGATLAEQGVNQFLNAGVSEGATTLEGMTASTAAAEGASTVAGGQVAGQAAGQIGSQVAGQAAGQIGSQVAGQAAGQATAATVASGATAASGAAGGASAGAESGSALGPWGALGGAVLGAALGYFLS